jgi:uncharacterized protein (TIRG00374 family)
VNKKNIALSIIGLFAVSILMYVSDISEILSRAKDIGWFTLGIILFLSFTAAGFKSLVLKTVLEGLESKISIPSALLTYYAVLFSNNITPFGNAGAEPVAAHFVRKLDGVDSYEKGLVAVTSSDIINQFSPNLLAIIGLVGIALTDLTTGTKLFFVPLVVGLLMLGLIIVLLFRFTIIEKRIRKYIPKIISVARTRIGWSFIPTVSSVESRIDKLVDAVETLSKNKIYMVIAIIFSFLSICAYSSLLYLTILSFGGQISIFVLLIIVPIGSAGAISPTPGAIGSSEVLVSTLLVVMGGLSLPVATGSVVIVRFTNFVLPTVVGWLCASFIQKNRDIFTS